MNLQQIQQESGEEFDKFYEENHNEHKNCNTRSGECSCEFLDLKFFLISSQQKAWNGALERVWDELFDSYPLDMENFDTRTESQSHRLLKTFWGKLENLREENVPTTMGK